MTHSETSSAKLYKIRNRKTGRFSQPRAYTGWSKYGKTWRIDALKSHLRLHMKSDHQYYGKSVDDIEIVEYVQTETDLDMPLGQMLAALRIDEIGKEVMLGAKKALKEKEDRAKMYECLKKEFDGGENE